MTREEPAIRWLHKPEPGELDAVNPRKVTLFLSIFAWSGIP